MAKKVLVVDDAIFIRRIIKKILEENGYEVVGEAGNGNEAVERYKELKPDVVTLDIIMPDKDGIEALEEILGIDKEARVVMITAIEQRDALMRAIRLGATDYIVKPFENDRVLSAIGKAVGEG